MTCHSPPTTPKYQNVQDTKLRFSKMQNTKYGPNIQNSIKLAQY